MQISFKLSPLSRNKLVQNYVLFSNENFKVNSLDKLALGSNSKIINSITDTKEKDVNFTNLNLDTKERVILIKLKKNNSLLEIETLGADFLNYVEKNLFYNLTFLDINIKDTFKKDKIFFERFIHGIRNKSYKFEKYKSKSKTKEINIEVLTKDKNFSLNKNKKLNALAEGIKLTKDLVSEPGNILHPDEYVKRITQLKKDGLKVTVYDKNKLKKLGMNALLGVGQGSIRGSYLATIEWNGGPKNKKPLAVVGKGVCFDTGGISLKPAKFMEDMTYDMAGSAVVVGLMKNLALRKAKVNAVGVVGLVENMVSGNAQRPGDIVKSYSGKTIEILNTDAEGRLVLADALSFTEKKFKPKFIIDLATLTGAIIVSLGSEYAGLFSNNDKLSKEIFETGQKVGEKVWRMPLHDNYDKLINCKKADMQNINYVGGAGSTTAAQFLQRFILNKTPWAHLDIAGMAFSKYGGALNSDGATGFGVRLLNQLIEDNHE